MAYSVHSCEIFRGTINSPAFFSQVCIIGPSGCGKTECIRTLGAAHREMGHLVKTDIVCTEAVESDELLGYTDTETRFVIAYLCEICGEIPE